jgi:hypothetical protein
MDLFRALGDHNPQIEASRWTAPPGSVQRIWHEEQGRGEPYRIADLDRGKFVFANAYFRARGWKGDLAPYAPARDMLAPNLNVLFGIANVRS